MSLNLRSIAAESEIPELKFQKVKCVAAGSSHALNESLCSMRSEIVVLKENGDLTALSLFKQSKRSYTSLSRKYKTYQPMLHNSVTHQDGLVFTSAVSISQPKPSQELVGVNLIRGSNFKVLDSIFFSYSSFSNKTRHRNPLHVLKPFTKSNLVLGMAYTNIVFLISHRNNKLALQDSWSFSEGRAPLFSAVLLDQEKTVAVSFQTELYTSLVCLVPLIKT